MQKGLATFAIFAGALGLCAFGARALAQAPSPAPPVAALPLPESAFGFVHGRFIARPGATPRPRGERIRDVHGTLEIGSRHANARFIEPGAASTAPRPAILFVHWLGEPETTNLTEFEPEMRALAERGAVTMAIDTMWATPKWFMGVRSTDTDYDASLRQVTDLRAALDALADRHDVDKQRIAFVGHDFGAMYGAVLSGFDARPSYFVFIAGTTTFAEWYLLGKKPADVDAYTRTMTPLDPLPYLRASHGSDYLYQFALKDGYIPLDRARAFFDASPSPKALALYQDDHGLRSRQAVADRIAWLASRLQPNP